MIERFAARLRVHLLRVVRAGADHIMGVVAGLYQHAFDLREIADLRSHPLGEVDQRLALIFGGIFLGVGVENCAFRRSEEHTSELQSLMRISYAVFCLKKKIKNMTYITKNIIS